MRNQSSFFERFSTFIKEEESVNTYFKEWKDIPMSYTKLTCHELDSHDIRYCMWHYAGIGHLFVLDVCHIKMPIFYKL